MKVWLLLLPLALIDFIIINAWVGTMFLDNSVSIYLLYIIPEIIIANLIIAGIVYFIKRSFAKLFLVNAVVASIIMIHLFNAPMGGGVGEGETWNFTINDTAYLINHETSHPADGTRFELWGTLPNGTIFDKYRGKFIDSGSFYLLKADTISFIIRNNFLFGFNGTDSITLTEIKY